MACLDMYNSEHKGNNHHQHCSPMSPRISFSNDFVDVQQAMKQEQRGSRSEPVSSDFEFSVSNYSMMSADELFFKGRLLSYKGNCNNQMQQKATTTLKEELLVNDDEYESFSLRPPKAYSTRWKGLLGLRKAHIGSKKPHKSTESSSEARPALINEGPPINISSSDQELLNDGGSSC